MSAKGAKGPNKDAYKKLFEEADKNGDGFLSIRELHDLMKRGGSNMSDSQIADTFVFFDGPQGDKRITLQEFTEGLEAIVKFIADLEALFKELDKNGDGHLTGNELRGLLQKTGKTFTDKDVDNIIKEADKNGDNKISFAEFMNACT